MVRFWVATLSIKYKISKIKEVCTLPSTASFLFLFHRLHIYNPIRFIENITMSFNSHCVD